MRKITLAAQHAVLAALIVVSSWVYADPVWIDVRTSAENEADGIQGDLLIPHTEIVSKVEALFPDKNTEIFLYCRSGNRSGQAMAALKQAGYQAVSNAGSIGDARIQRNIID